MLIDNHNSIRIATPPAVRDGMVTCLEILNALILQMEERREILGLTKHLILDQLRCLAMDRIIRTLDCSPH